MKFVIKENKKNIMRSFTISAKEENLKEKEWFYSKKMRRLRQESGCGAVTFNGKSMDYLETLPYRDYLKKRKKSYEILWNTILLFKRRF